MLFFAFIGFNSISTLVEDARDRQKTVPKSLFITLVLVTLLYVAVSLGRDRPGWLPQSRCSRSSLLCIVLRKLHRGTHQDRQVLSVEWS